MQEHKLNLREIADEIKIMGRLQYNERAQLNVDFSDENVINAHAKMLDVSTNFFYKILAKYKEEQEKLKEQAFHFQNKNSEHISRVFPDEVYTSLPELLKQPCSRLTDKKEQEVYLVTALGFGSGMLPNVFGSYGGKEYGPNLYVYLIGPYGEGKGGLSYAQKLGEAIHKTKVAASIEFEKEYKNQIAQYRKACKLFEQNKINELPEEPTPPPHLKLYLPANIGKSGITQLLFENGGKAIIYALEADTLAEAIKQEHGGFSDVLRLGFGHEPISLFRRTGNEDTEIPFPCISVVLSSTFDQLLKLIPTIENGLYSRFLYYILEPSPNFINVFDKNKNGYTRYFTELGKSYQIIYDYLNSLNFPISFELQPSQEAKFLEVFQDKKTELREMVSSSLGGTANRLGLICFRIAMQLTVLRAFETKTLTENLICSDQDFENALRIVEVLKTHALSVYWQLPNPKEMNSNQSSDKDLKKSEQKRKCRELHAQRFSYREIAKTVFGDIKAVNKAYRFVNED